MPGMPGIPGPQGLQGRDGAKGQIGEKGSQGMLGQKGEKGNEGPRGKSGLPGMMGIKGTRGILGDQGIKGDKGEKGESVTRPSSAVPQTNWKQCVWRNDDDRDSGKIKVRSEGDVPIGIGDEQNYFYHPIQHRNPIMIYLVEWESEFYHPMFEYICSKLRSLLTVGFNGVNYNSHPYTRLNRDSAS